MSNVNYRNVRSAPPRISKLSELDNDLNLMTDKEVERRLDELIVVTSVNGTTGDVSLNLFSGNYVDLIGKPALFSGAYIDLIGRPTLFSGSYNDLTNKPTIPAAQVNCDWNAASGITQILNKPTLRKVETFTGVTNASGNFTVTYSVPYTNVPDVQPQLAAGTPSQVARITSSTTTGFTVQVTNRASVTLLAVEVLLAATTPVVGAAINVLVTSR